MAAKGLKRGLFITFEGVEGCGKSTHSRLIYRYLKKIGFPCLYTKEPGGTKIGGKIRNILLDPGNTALNDVAELFLFEANRAQVFSEVIKPALRHKFIVISDRFSDATMAYQGYGSRFNKSTIEAMNNLAAGAPKPDLTIVLNIDVKKGLRRARKKGRPDRMEVKPLSYHNRVRKGYLEIAKSEPRRVRLIKVKGSIEETQRLVRREVLNVIQRYKAAG